MPTDPLLEAMGVVLAVRDTEMLGAILGMMKDIVPAMIAGQTHESILDTATMALLHPRHMALEGEDHLLRRMEGHQ